MLRQIFAVFLSLFFVLLSQPLALSWGAYDSFLNRDFYDDEFVDLLYDYSVSTIVSGVDLSEFPTMDPDSFNDILVQVLTKEDLANIVDTIYDDIASVRTNDLGELEIKIPMDWVFDKTELISTLIADNLYQNLDVCPDSVLRGDSLTNFSCLHSLVEEEYFREAVLLSLDLSFFSDLPRELGFSLTLPDGVEARMKGLKSDIESMIFSFSLVLGLILVAIAILIFRPWNKVLSWLIRPLFVSSLMLLLLVLFFNYIPELISLMNPSFFTTLAETQLALSMRIYDFLISGFTSGIVLLAFPIFISTLTLWIGLFFYARRQASLISILDNDTLNNDTQ